MNDPNPPGWPPPPQGQPQPYPQAPAQPQPQGQPYPYPQAPGQPYPYPPGQPYPQAPAQPYPQAPAQPYPYPQGQPYAHPQGQPYAHPQAPGQPYPYPHPPPHAPGFAAWPPGAYARPQYEFTPEQNEILADLATWCGGLSILKMVGAVLSILGRNMLSGAIELGVGLTLWGGRKSLRAVVDTQGNDVTHLMAAVDKLATVFQIRLVLALIGAVAITVLVTIFVILAITAPEVLDEIMREA